MPAALVVGWLLAAASGLMILCPQHQARAFVEMDTPFMRKFGPPMDAALLTPNNTVAVDLGNTNSCIAGFDDDGGGETAFLFRICIPTRLAALDDDGELIVGEAAAAVDRPALFGLKRLLGKTRFVSGGAAWRIWEEAAAVFTELRARAEAHTGRTRVYHAVLTVPYYFGDASQGAAIFAATLAGLRTVRIVDEPTAAAVAHGLHSRLRDRGNVLVLHVGGGTSAAAVLRYRRDGGFDGVGSADDLFLGGDDFSRRITDHLAQLVKERHDGLDATSKDHAPLLRKLRMESERAKKELSFQHCVQVNVVFRDNANALMLFSETLTRAKFEELNQDLFARVMALVDRAIGESGLNQSKHLIDDIVLTGGSTRIPRIRQLVKSYFDGKEPMSTMAPARPEQIVAFGGALLGHPAVGGYRCRGRDWRQRYNSTDWCYPDERIHGKKADGGWAACGSTFAHGFVMVIHRAKAECFRLLKTWLETISSYFQNTSPSAQASKFEEPFML